MKTLILMAAAALSLAAQSLPKINEAGYPKMLAAQKGKVVLVDFWRCLSHLDGTENLTYIPAGRCLDHDTASGRLATLWA